MSFPIACSFENNMNADAEARTHSELLTTTTLPSGAVRPDKPERNLWREQEMLTVLQIIRDHNYLALLNDKTVRSETVFRNIEKEMNDRGLRKKNFQQIWTKWKFLKSTYMTSRRIHQIPKIIPLDVYESLDELLSSEFRNDGSVSSYDGGEYDDCGASSYEMMNSSASTSGNDGLLVISNVQGGVTYNGCRNFADLNGCGGPLRKLKNGFRVFKNEEENNGFGMQHPIFGYRLGVVKDEPIDDEYENNINADENYSDAHQDEQQQTQQFPDLKTEILSPPHSLPPPEEQDLPPLPAMQLPPMTSFSPSTIGTSPPDPEMPPLHRYTPPSFPLSRQSELPLHPPPLKHMPLVKINIPQRQQDSTNSPLKHPSPPIPTIIHSKKIPVLTLRKRKKRLNIPQLSEGTNSPAPSSKHSKNSEEEETKGSVPISESMGNPLHVTYGKAMREMSISLREIQREMIDEFFKQQMDLAKSEHEFQKQQDAILLRCFEDQTKMLLDGAKRLFSASIPIAPDLVYINNE